jgi:pimeloyl-ACP methyl ester carboxylesterase
MTIRRTLLWLIVASGLSCVFARSGSAQESAAGETVSLATRDGVQLKITYFPGSERKGTDKAKQTTPVVFLHDYKGSRAVFTPLVQKLQASKKEGAEGPSFAAVTVDLRAHGESVKAVANGADVDLDPARLNKQDLFAMVQADMDAVRDFVVEKNDAGELNLNKLCLVGSGMGASVAANWALVDWSYPPLAIGKQGQDVKALALISPRWSYNGLLMQGPMKDVPLMKNAAWLLIYGGKDTKFQADALRMNKQLERHHPKTDKTGAARNSGLALVNLPTRLQGDLLLTQVPGCEDQVVKFLVENVGNTRAQWISRRTRLP